MPRFRHFKGVFLVALAAAVGVAGAARADFDPKGKKKKPPAGVVSRPGAVRPPAPIASGEPEPKKDPIKKAAVIAMARPGESGPVLKLAQLYRERDGSLDKGSSEWREKASDSTLSADDRWAAQVTLAGLLKSDRRDKEAQAAYEAAIAQQPDRPIAIIALARLKQDSGDLDGAYAEYEKALPLHKDKADREATLRTLMELAVDRKDPANAKKWHEQLVKQNGDSMAVRAELARTWFRKNQFERAETEYEQVVRAAAGDNRTLPAALLDLGIAQTRLQKYPEAVKTLRKGLALAGAQAGVKPRLLNALAEVYRLQNKIEDFVAELEKENPGDVDRQELLGRLAAEFDADKAIKWLGKALAAAPSHTDSRVLLIRLLKEQSKLDEAVRQYDQLIRHARGQAQFVFELCDLLIGRGERPRCLGRLKAMESTTAADPEVQQRLAGYYSQIGEDGLALALMEKLATGSANDPSYIVDLGDYYYQRNNTSKAKEIWKRLTVVVKPRHKGLAQLGETYLDHDLGEDALEAYRQALELAPGEVTIQKGHAAALERVHRFGEAQGVWEAILKRSDVDKATRREARTHLVLLWLAQKKLAEQIRPLSDAFKGPPVNLEAGRLLAEVQLHLRRLADAEQTLRDIIKQSAGDVDARLVLERVLVQQGQVANAIRVLEELVRADPKGARSYYTRLAQYALQLYKDEDALKYAAAAVELAPDDPDGHKKLGEMYRSQQDFARAVKEFKLALFHNPKMWAVYFELAELYLAQGDEVEADALYRRVMRGAGDDELVANAIRFSAAINQKRGTLEVLEAELLPITLSSPQKTVYRRLLVEVYANLTAPLIHEVKAGQVKAGGAEAVVAHSKLVKIGARGVQPLIDALSDADVAQQKTAIEILAFVENRSAGAPLFAYATESTKAPTGSSSASGPAPVGAPSTDPTLRARAMVAVGALRDPALLPKYEAYLFPKSGPMPKDPIATAAAFGLARMTDRKAVPLQLKLVESFETLPVEMRIYAVLALGRTRDRAHVPVIEAFLKRSDAGPYGRAAALYALGEIGDPRSRATLSSAIETSSEPGARQSAILALARMMVGAGGDRDRRKAAQWAATDPAVSVHVGTFAAAALDPNPGLRRAASIALAALTVGEFRAVPDTMPVPDGPIQAASTIAPLTPTTYGPADFAAALVAHERVFTGAVSTALQTSKERSIVALDAMLARPGGPALGVFTEGAPAAGRPPGKFAAALEVAGRIANAAEPFVAGLVHHPEVAVQTRAVRWLGRRETPAARDALGEALGEERSSDVLRLALEELSMRGDASSVKDVTWILAHHKQWSVRADAARSLGAIGKRDPNAEVGAPLEKAATTDPFAFVRETALRGLAAAARPNSRSVLEKAARSDPEPRVRTLASALANSLKGA